MLALVIIGAFAAPCATHDIVAFRVPPMSLCAYEPVTRGSPCVGLAQAGAALFGGKALQSFEAILLQPALPIRNVRALVAPGMLVDDTVRACLPGMAKRANKTVRHVAQIGALQALAALRLRGLL